MPLATGTAFASTNRDSLIRCFDHVFSQKAIGNRRFCDHSGAQLAFPEVFFGFTQRYGTFLGGCNFCQPDFQSDYRSAYVVDRRDHLSVS
jgi:hypothetical protein